jgi:hypothetical protein
MLVSCITSSTTFFSVRDATERGRKKVGARTNRLLLLLVALAGLDAVLCLLGLGDGLLDGQVPAVALRCGLGIERVLGARDLEGKAVGTILVEIGSVRLSYVNKGFRGLSGVFVRTRLRTPAGCSLLSACLTKYSSPFPVWVDQAATECATSGFSPRRYSLKLAAGTASSPSQKYFLEERKALWWGLAVLRWLVDRKQY